MNDNTFMTVMIELNTFDDTGDGGDTYDNGNCVNNIFLDGISN